MPQRIQRQRTKGWRAPEGAIYVGRPSKWGNPFAIGKPVGVECYSPSFHHLTVTVATREAAVMWFESILTADYSTSVPTVFEPPHGWMAALRGHDLMCWCPLDQPCHADVLLELANREGL